MLQDPETERIVRELEESHRAAYQAVALVMKTQRKAIVDTTIQRLLEMMPHHKRFSPLAMCPTQPVALSTLISPKNTLLKLSLSHSNLHDTTTVVPSPPSSSLHELASQSLPNLLSIELNTSHPSDTSATVSTCRSPLSKQRLAGKLKIMYATSEPTVLEPVPPQHVRSTNSWLARPTESDLNVEKGPGGPPLRNNELFQVCGVQSSSMDAAGRSELISQMQRMYSQQVVSGMGNK